MSRPSFPAGPWHQPCTDIARARKSPSNRRGVCQGYREVPSSLCGRPRRHRAEAILNSAVVLDEANINLESPAASSRASPPPRAGVPPARYREIIFGNSALFVSKTSPGGIICPSATGARRLEIVMASRLTQAVNSSAARASIRLTLGERSGASASSRLFCWPASRCDEARPSLTLRSNLAKHRRVSMAIISSPAKSGVIRKIILRPIAIKAAGAVIASDNSR